MLFVLLFVIIPRDITKLANYRQEMSTMKNDIVSHFFFYSFFLFLIHLSLDLFRLHSHMVDKIIWMAQPTQTSRLLPKFLSFFLSPMLSVSVWYCLTLRTNEMEEDGKVWTRKLKVLAAYLTRVTSDLLRRLYHTLCGAVQATLTTLHVIGDRGLLPRNRG